MIPYKIDVNHKINNKNWNKKDRRYTSVDITTFSSRFKDYFSGKEETMLNLVAK